MYTCTTCTCTYDTLGRRIIFWARSTVRTARMEDRLSKIPRKLAIRHSSRDPGNSVVTPPPSTCNHNSPCYPGVDCRDTPSGPQCGPCLRGYTGNGRVCVKINVVTCHQQPCFQGVRCYDDNDNGYR